MLKIGITGGIGSGKTTACRLFEKLDVPVYYADDRAKWIQNNDPILIDAIKNLFGEDIYVNGILDRASLGKIVFSDKNKLEALNAIVHPAVFKDANDWQEMHKKSGALYTLKEAALLFETGSYKALDKIIVVSAPLELRIERVMQRDNLSREEVQKRINSQMSQEEKEKMSDFILHNINLEKLKEEVQNLHNLIIDKYCSKDLT
jgi:dephospho-CoA kinase